MNKPLHFLLIAIFVIFILSTTFPTYADNTVQTTNFVSPLEQFKTGTPVSNVKCNDDLQLVIKAEDGSPACVKPNATNILIERGWAKEIFSHGLNNSILPASIQCDTYYPQPNNDGVPLNLSKTLNENTFPLIYMPKNSSGSICVNYYDILHSGPVGLHIFESSPHLINNPLGITISASQNTISGMSGNETVVYTINTGNYSGLFGISTFCSSIYFAVGYDVSNMTHSNFTWSPYGSKSCPAGFYYDGIVGLHGIGFKFIH